MATASAGFSRTTALGFARQHAQLKTSRSTSACSMRSDSPHITIDQDRLVEWASQAIGTPSFTGSEEAMAELMRETFLDMGLHVQWQQVEDGRANVLGIREGTDGGPSLMFNGHMD